MDIASLVQKFLQSSHGQQASSSLSQAGFDDAQVQDILSHAATAGAEHVEASHAESGGILGHHAGASFFAAFAAGIVKGDGLVGALEDGALGVVIGRITEALTARLGMDSAAADAAAAATAPYVMAFLKEHIGI
jgi:hypothetical protein